jgi:hypothetical protein
MTLPGLHPNPRPTPTPAAPMTEDERTRTLQGLGLDRATLRGLGEPAARGGACPCCRIKLDALPSDLAACFAVALVVTKGAPATQQTLCTMHARLLRLLVDEIQNPPTPGKDGSSWDD